MPALKEYVARADSLQPSERGTSARVMGGRRIHGYYNQAADEQEGAARAQAAAAADVAGAVASVGRDVTDIARQAEDHLGHREVSKGAAEGATLFNTLTKQWDDVAKRADPNDPTVAAKFREEVLEPSLQKFKDAYSTTDRGIRWSESHVESMRNHFFTKTTADMAGLAEAAVGVNVRQLGNQSSNTARSSPDMHTVDYLVNDVPRSVAEIVDSSPNLRGAAAAKVRMGLTEKMQEQIVKAGALGAMERAADPEKVVSTFAERYPQFINGQELEQFAKMARYYKRLDDGERRSARQEADYNARREFHIEANKLEGEMIPEDPSQPLQMPKDGWKRLRELSSTPGAALEPGRLKAMVTQLQAVSDRLNKPEPLARVSNANAARLLTDIREGRITDMTPLYETYGKGGLTNGDFKFLQQAFTDMRTPAGERLSRGVDDLVKAVKPSIDKSNPLLGKTDQDGSINLYRFQTDLQRKVAEYRKAGKDPHDLLDPSKPDFFGKPENLSRYQKTLTQSAADTAARLTGKKPMGNLTDPGNTITGMTVEDKPVPPPMPRKQGESPDAYLKRIGAK